MKTMYKVSFPFAKITAMSVLSETEKTVLTEKGREKKIGDFHAWFDTYPEAYKALTEYAHAKITAAAEAQRQAQAFAEKVTALAPEKPSNA